MNQQKENSLPVKVSRSISSKWQVVIPLEVRQYLSNKHGEIQQGDELMFTINQDGEVLLDIKKEPDIMDLFGSLPPKERSHKDFEEILKEAKEERMSQRMRGGAI